MPEDAFDRDLEYRSLAVAIEAYGKPFTGGDTVLRHTARGSVMACATCGQLPATTAGWTSDWLALCEEARRHALQEGHEVAVHAWNGATYGPRPELPLSDYGQPYIRSHSFQGQPR